MKRYFFGILAVAIAITLASFTTSSRPVDMFVFQYDPAASGGYDELDVENESNTNWKYVGKNVNLCDNDDTKACRVSVTGSYVNSTSTPTALLNVTITATEVSNVAYVDGITNSPTNLYSNKP